MITISPHNKGNILVLSATGKWNRAMILAWETATVS